MDLEKAPGVFQGWLGCEVEVSAHGCEDADPVAAVSVRGRRRSAEDIGGVRDGQRSGEAELALCCGEGPGRVADSVRTVGFAHGLQGRAAIKGGAR